MWAIELISFSTVMFALVLNVAVTIAIIVRMARNELNIESLQVWFRDAYGLLMSYDEAARSLAILYSGQYECRLTNEGSLTRIGNGIVYEPPLKGDHNHEI